MSKPICGKRRSVMRLTLARVNGLFLSSAQKNSPGGLLDPSPDCVPPGMSASKKRRRPGAKVCIGQAGFNALAILADCKSRDASFSRLPKSPAQNDMRSESWFDSSSLAIKPIFRTIGFNPRRRSARTADTWGNVERFCVAGLLA